VFYATYIARYFLPFPPFHLPPPPPDL
jgi:hypothetical protein